MFLEMFFAIMAFLTATAAFGSFQGSQAGGRGRGRLLHGPVAVHEPVGPGQMLGTGFGMAYGSVFLTLMALTIMYLVVRFMRVASAEALGDRSPPSRTSTSARSWPCS